MVLEGAAFKGQQRGDVPTGEPGRGFLGSEMAALIPPLCSQHHSHGLACERPQPVLAELIPAM